MEKAQIASLAEQVRHHLESDDLVVSGPVMSTLVDATGLFIYFTTAGLMLGI